MGHRTREPGKLRETITIPKRKLVILAGKYEQSDKRLPRPEQARWVSSKTTASATYSF
ncbi:hypothetical protein Mapa_016166 [Marchantia paleacea]|nr:hypothetical protein Mapa_016166 [Marchantia paleacea]